jgi:hypothetical protein
VRIADRLGHHAAMHDDGTTQRAVGFLLRLIDTEDAAGVRRRIGVPAAAVEERRITYAVLKQSWVPASVLLWILEQDDPELNAVVYGHVSADPAMRRAVLRGLPFGPGRTDTLPVDDVLLRHADEPPEPVRPDCPPALRAQFGSHAKFTHRVRQAGILAGPGEYATAHGPAAQVLKVLSLGPVMFPARVGEAEDALRPLVRDHLAGREEPWAVLAQLLGTFHGTAPELIMTAGAIA